MSDEAMSDAIGDSFPDLLGDSVVNQEEYSIKIPVAFT